MELLQLTLAGGVMVGVIYAVAGASQVVLYRTSGYVSFAHGDIAAVALYAGLAVHQLGLPYPAVAGTVVVVGTVLAAVIGTLVVIPIGRFGPLAAVMATVAVGLAIQGVENLAGANSPKSFPSVGDATLFHIGYVAVTGWMVLIVVAGVLVFGGLGLGFARTTVGAAMRAVHDSPAAADLMGIPTRRLSAYSWALSGALAGLAGLFIAPMFALTPHSVNVFLVFAFGAIVVGGFESIFGALVAGILLGVAGNLVTAYIDPGIVNFSIFLMIFAMLLIRPSGLFGRATLARV